MLSRGFKREACIIGDYQIIRLTIFWKITCKVYIILQFFPWNYFVWSAFILKKTWIIMSNLQNNKTREKNNVTSCCFLKNVTTNCDTNFTVSVGGRIIMNWNVHYSNTHTNGPASIRICIRTGVFDPKWTIPCLIISPIEKGVISLCFDNDFKALSPLQQPIDDASSSIGYSKENKEENFN